MTEEGKEPEKCPICGRDLLLEWSICHGHAHCRICHCPYIVLHYDDHDKLISTVPTLNLKDPEKNIPPLKKLWEESGEDSEKYLVKAREYFKNLPKEEPE